MHKLLILVLFDMYLLSGHTSWVMSVALSADGSKVVSGSYDNTVKIWSADSGEVLQTLSGDIDMKHICILCNIEYSRYVSKVYCIIFSNNIRYENTI